MSAGDAERGTGKDGEGNSMFSAGDGGEEERDKEEKVCQKDGGNSLPPRHAEIDKTSGKVVGRNANDHAYPKSGKVP